MGAPSAAQAGTSGVVIIGAGQAGYQTAESLRQSGYEHPITLLGAEPHSPYSRPPLSKAYLLGETDQERLLFRAPAFYTDRNIDLRLNCTVAAIDRAAKTVTLAEGETLGYDHLVIATGATPRILPLPGAELEGVYSLKTLADVEQIEAALPGIESVAVIGAGFIGLEFAAVARKLGKAVTVLEAAPRVMGRVVPPELSAFFEAEHRAQDVTLHCEVRIEALLPGEDGRLGSIQLADGSQVPAQMVIVGIGVTPNVGLAEAAGLACDNGILVNDRCQTDDPAIFAAGDCASSAHPFAGGQIRLESVQNASDQGKVIASVITGGDKRNDIVPWFWSDQYDLKLQMAGLHAGCDHAVMRGNPEDRKFSIFHFRGTELRAVDSVNRPSDHIQGRKLMTAGVSPSPEQAADPAFKLTSLLK